MYLMIPVHLYYLTGADGEKYFGVIDSYQYQGDDIFSFRFDYSGDRFEIKKNDNRWIYAGGMAQFLIHWIDELGSQIDQTNHF